MQAATQTDASPEGQAILTLGALGVVYGDIGTSTLVILGAVVLAFTGAEALYADMGHFGRRPIRRAWAGLVLPSLALNYLGQGALLMHTPGAAEHPFYHLFPGWLLVPAVLIATAATIVASQAVITGAYSLTQQAIQLGLLPRMQVRYTSEKEMGQVYLPLVNWLLLLAVVLTVVGFGDSSALASAYGIAVTITMFITTALAYFVVRHAWGYPAWLATAATSVFLAVDIVLVISCALKFADGGWFPVVLGAMLFTLMATWRRGRELLMENLAREAPKLQAFLAALDGEDLPRARRTAVYVVANPDVVPPALMHNLRHNQVLHERNLVLTVAFHDIPRVPAAGRVEVLPLAARFWRITVNYGFKDNPDIPDALRRCSSERLPIDLFETTYFLGRETIVRKDRHGMPRWRQGLFAFMMRNAGGAADFLRLPSNCVIELGTRVPI